jgi:hypothetical protein
MSACAGIDFLQVQFTEEQARHQAAVSVVTKAIKRLVEDS